MGHLGALHSEVVAKGYTWLKDFAFRVPRETRHSFEDTAMLLRSEAIQSASGNGTLPALAFRSHGDIRDIGNLAFSTPLLLLNSKA